MTKEMSKTLTDIQIEVNKVMEKRGKRLWKVSESDALRMLKWKVWEERHSVGLEEILDILLAVFVAAVQKRTGRVSNGLGVRVAVLTGDAAEETLKRELQKRYPGRENWYGKIEEKKASLLEMPEGKPRRELSYDSATEQVKAYREKIKKRREAARERIRTIRERRYRGNPFY